MLQDRKPQRRKPRAQKERGGDKVERRKLKLKSTSNKLFPVGKRGGSPHVTGVWTRRGNTPYSTEEMEEISEAGKYECSILQSIAI